MTGCCKCNGYSYQHQDTCWRYRCDSCHVRRCACCPYEIKGIEIDDYVEATDEYYHAGLGCDCKIEKGVVVKIDRRVGKSASEPIIIATVKRRDGTKFRVNVFWLKRG